MRFPTMKLSITPGREILLIEELVSQSHLGKYNLCPFFPDADVDEGLMKVDDGRVGV